MSAVCSLIERTQDHDQCHGLAGLSLLRFINDVTAYLFLDLDILLAGCAQP